MQNYHAQLTNAGIRPSVQRMAVYSYLCEHPVHPTVETLYKKLSPDYPTLSKTTIYNTLKLFEEKHLVQSVKIEDDRLRFDAEARPHLHFKCEQCGKVFDIFDEKDISDYTMKCSNVLPHGFSMKKLETNIWGICADCAKKTEK